MTCKNERENMNTLKGLALAFAKHHGIRLETTDEYEKVLAALKILFKANVPAAA